MIERSVRKVDREIAKLQTAEKKHLKEVESLAKKGQHAAAKTVAKTVAMTRNQVNSMYQMSAQLKGIGMQMSAMGTQKTVMEALGSAS